MALIYLSLGSNIEPQRHICAALDALAEHFGELQISTVYESESVGFEGENFFNLVVGVHSDLAIGEISAILKAIENANGRDRRQPRFSSRSLDIDILTVDDLAGVFEGIALPRDEVLKNAFVLQPLAQLAPHSVHPVTGQSFAQHWQQYDKTEQQLWPVEFCWQQRQL
jgi:2-amino-4-hydroxy-6-hydroxymethyldihydropteridine diphosphokinase